MEESKHSKFSSGLNIITRLDLLWRNCSEYKRQGKYLRWCEELDTIWLELARDIDEDEYNDKKEEKKEIRGCESKFKKFDDDLIKELPFLDSGKGFSEITPAEITKRNKQYEILMKKQLFLARLENKYGKGTTYEDEDEDF